MSSLNIIRDQEREVRQMSQWYKDWYGKDVPQRSDMSGEHGISDGVMAEDLNQLHEANNFDLEFMRQMISHHEGAIKMAQEVLPKTQHKEIKDLAGAIIASQSKEIQQMRALETKFTAA